MIMKHSDYMSVSMAIFGIIGLGHLWRAYQQLPANIGDMSIPVGLSWIVGVVALYLAYSAYKIKH